MRRMLKRDIFRTPYFIPQRPISSFVSYFCLNQWRLYFCNSFPLEKALPRPIAAARVACDRWQPGPRAAFFFLIGLTWRRRLVAAERSGGGGRERCGRREAAAAGASTPHRVVDYYGGR
jgi:hypothetical protein